MKMLPQFTILLNTIEDVVDKNEKEMMLLTSHLPFIYSLALGRVYLVSSQVNYLVKACLMCLSVCLTGWLVINKPDVKK